MLNSLIIGLAPILAPTLPTPVPAPALDLSCTECELTLSANGVLNGFGGAFFTWGLAPAAVPNGECASSGAGCAPQKGCEFSYAVQWDVGSLGASIRLQTLGLSESGEVLRRYTTDSGHVSVPTGTSGGSADDLEVPCGSTWNAVITIRYVATELPPLQAGLFAGCDDCAITETP